MASLFKTYVLWLLFGWLGLHHLYLNRWNQAIAWVITLGGGCGLGWLRDVWRIPDYVAWTNKDPQFERSHLHMMAMSKSPPCSTFRLCGMLGLGFLLSLGLCAMVPEYIHHMPAKPVVYYCWMLAYIGAALVGSTMGVYLVSNIGELSCPLTYPMVGSLAGLPWMLSAETNIIMPAVTATMAAWLVGLRWRPLADRDARSTAHLAILLYCTVVSLWCGVLSYGVYHNAHVTINGGPKVPLRVVVTNFFKSSAWHNTKGSFYSMWVTYHEDGWSSAYYNAWDIMDFSGEANSLKILGLGRNASHDEIKKACREMSRKYHPDLQRSEEAKVKGQEKFIQVQEACSVLNKFKKDKS